MKGLDMYSKIQKLKEEGLNRSQAARDLQINYKTVRKYWDMTLNEYNVYQQAQANRATKLAKYKDDILFLLHKHNDYSSAQILDRLWEKYPGSQDEIRPSTLRRYIHHLCIEYNIPKTHKAREYQAVVDPPMGYQAQVTWDIKLSMTQMATLTNYAQLQWFYLTHAISMQSGLTITQSHLTSSTFTNEPSSISAACLKRLFMIRTDCSL